MTKSRGIVQNQNSPDKPNSADFNSGYRLGLYTAFERCGDVAAARLTLQNALLKNDRWARLINETRRDMSPRRNLKFKNMEHNNG